MSSVSVQEVTHQHCFDCCSKMDLVLKLAFLFAVAGASADQGNVLDAESLKKTQVLGEMVNYWMQETEQMEKLVEEYKVSDYS